MKLSFKFFPIKDLFYSVVPTAGTYGGYIQGIAPKFIPNVWIAIIIGIVLSIVLATIFILGFIASWIASSRVSKGLLE